MKILIPIDGSAAAAHAFAHALGLAQRNADIQLILLNVQNIQTLELSDILPRLDTAAALGAAASEKILAQPLAHAPLLVFDAWHDPNTVRSPRRSLASLVRQRSTTL